MTINLEKGKGLIVGKLRLIELIQGNLQILIKSVHNRIIVREMNSNYLDLRNMKQCRSRRGIWIDNILLEKVLFFEYIKVMERYTDQVMTDGKSHCDRIEPEFSLLISYCHRLWLEIAMILRDMCNQKCQHNKAPYGLNYLPTCYSNGIDPLHGTGKRKILSMCTQMFIPLTKIKLIMKNQINVKYEGMLTEIL